MRVSRALSCTPRLATSHWYCKCPQGRLDIHADTDMPALCAEVLNPLCAAQYSHDLGLKNGRIPPQEQKRYLSVPAMVVPRSGPILGSRSVSEPDIAMPCQDVPMLQPFLSGGYGHRPIPPKVEALRNEIRPHSQQGFF